MLEPEPLICSAEDQALLLGLAHDAIQAAIVALPPSWPAPESLSETLRTPAAAFVTLHLKSRLRGCVGTLTPRDALYRAVGENAVGAALRDTRFPPVTRAESDDLHVHVSVLSPMVPLPEPSGRDGLPPLRPGEDGVVLRYAGRTATFLPQVWETFPDPILFLEALSKKAGLKPSAWRDNEAQLLRYRVTAFGDSAS
jgi:AmmeMemoRadiSam system protein A